MNLVQVFFFFCWLLSREYGFFAEIFKRKFTAGRNFCCNTDLPHLSPGGTTCLSSISFPFCQIQAFWAPRTQPSDAAEARLEDVYFGYLLADSVWVIKEGSVCFTAAVIWEKKIKKRQSQHAVLEVKKINFAGCMGNLAFLSPSWWAGDLCDAIWSLRRHHTWGGNHLGWKGPLRSSSPIINAALPSPLLNHQAPQLHVF